MSLSRLSRTLSELGGLWEKNVGRWDARGRVGVGLVLLALTPLHALGYAPLPVFTLGGAAVAGGVLLVEGVLSRCVLYSLLGINRCPVDTSPD